VFSIITVCYATIKSFGLLSEVPFMDKINTFATKYATECLKWWLWLCTAAIFLQRQFWLCTTAIFLQWWQLWLVSLSEVPFMDEIYTFATKYVARSLEVDIDTTMKTVQWSSCKQVDLADLRPNHGLTDGTTPSVLDYVANDIQSNSLLEVIMMAYANLVNKVSNFFFFLTCRTSLRLSHYNGGLIILRV